MSEATQIPGELNYLVSGAGCDELSVGILGFPIAHSGNQPCEKSGRSLSIGFRQNGAVIGGSDVGFDLTCVFRRPQRGNADCAMRLLCHVKMRLVINKSMLLHAHIKIAR